MNRPILNPFDAGFLKAFDPNQPRDEHGRWSSDGAGGPPAKAEVFAAALRGFKGTRAAVRMERTRNPKIAQLKKDIGSVAGEFGGVTGGRDMEHVTIKEQNEAQGAWVETGPNGEPLYVSEPSFHVVVSGSEREIYRRASALGKKYDQQAVAVAVHDAGAQDSGVYKVSFGGGMQDADMEAVTQHFIDRGLGGATSFLDKNELRLIATKKSEQNIINRALESVPKSYGAKLEFTPARVRFIAMDEYDQLLKVAPSGKVTADVFIMGLPKKR